MSGARRQTTREAAPHQSVAFERDRGQNRSAEPGFPEFIQFQVDRPVARSAVSTSCDLDRVRVMFSPWQFSKGYNDRESERRIERDI